MNPIYLLQQASVTGNPVLIPRAGQYLWQVSGTFNSAKALLQYLGPDGVNWQGHSYGIAAGKLTVPLDITEDTLVRVVILGGTSPQITSWLEFVA